jgi:uncharacterized protein (TIGR02646 family)
MKEFKKSLKKQLLIFQHEECAFCGLKLGETGKTEIEHIAPKGGEKRPTYVRYMFTTCNLVLACNLCNSPFKKGQKNTIDNFDENNENYRLNNFNIYHPYFDNPDDHFEYNARRDQIIIVAITTKGQKTIDVFDLDGEPHCTARAKSVIYESMRQEPDIENLLNEALTYNITH